jgi:alkylation response protein AidB-like acyl-CoA dehydrogenase
MTVTGTSATLGADPVEDLRAWLEENWDPDLTVGEWWERLGLAGWANPILPPDCFGRGLSRGDVVRVSSEIARFGALGAPVGLGLNLAAPTIATHGTKEQIDAYIPDIVTGRMGWCQLFSEPGAGSDLAGLTTRAVRDGDVWIVNGQKVWTSGGHLADLGMLLARTNPEAPKHQGISWFALDMHQPGVEVRPLKEMTGQTAFSEVFFTDAVVPDRARLGDVNNGWTVANTTLAFERSGMGAGGGAAAARRGALAARPGTVARDLQKRAGDLVTRPSAAPVERAKPSSPAQQYINLARETGRISDPAIRQRLAQAHILGTLTRLTARRGRHPRRPQLLEAADGAHTAVQPRPRHGAARRPGHAPRLRQRRPGRAGERGGRAGRHGGHGPGPGGPGPAHLRRHRPDPAQHHRRARPRAAQGAG